MPAMPSACGFSDLFWTRSHLPASTFLPLHLSTSLPPQVGLPTTLKELDVDAGDLDAIMKVMDDSSSLGTPVVYSTMFDRLL